VSHRQKKKAAPIAGSVELHVADDADLEARMDKIRALWRDAGSTVDLPTSSQIEDLAWLLTACVALPTNAEKERQDAVARAAIKALLAWCRYDPSDNGLPHLVFRDRKIVSLEAALLCAQPLAEAPPARAWVNRAWSVWSKAAAITNASGGKAGHSAKSHAVRFTSLALRWVGHPAATAEAVGKELRKRISD
jgi:hypothetical protein